MCIDFKSIVDAPAYNPNNFLIHFNNPNIFFFIQRQFLIDEKTGQLLLFLHAQWIKIIAFLPFS